MLAEPLKHEVLNSLRRTRLSSRLMISQLLYHVFCLRFSICPIWLAAVLIMQQNPRLFNSLPTGKFACFLDERL